MNYNCPAVEAPFISDMTMNTGTHFLKMKPTIF